VEENTTLARPDARVAGVGTGLGHAGEDLLFKVKEIGFSFILEVVRI